MPSVRAALMAAFPDPPDPEHAVRNQMSLLRRETAEVYKGLQKVYRLNRFGFGFRVNNLELGHMAILMTLHCASSTGQAISPYSPLPALFWNRLASEHDNLKSLHRCQKCTVLKMDNGKEVKSCPFAFQMFQGLVTALFRSRLCAERDETPEGPEDTALTVELRDDSPMEDGLEEPEGQDVETTTEPALETEAPIEGALINDPKEDVEMVAAPQEDITMQDDGVVAESQTFTAAESAPVRDALMEDVPAVEAQSEITPAEVSCLQIDYEMADEPVPAEESADGPVFSNIAPPVDFALDVASAAAEEASYKEPTESPCDILDDFEGHQQKAWKQAAKIEITEREFLELVPGDDDMTNAIRAQWAAEVFVVMKTEADLWTKRHSHLGLNNSHLKRVARIVEDIAAARADNDNLPKLKEEEETGTWVKKWVETELTDLQVYEREVERIRDDMKRDRTAFFKNAVRRYLKKDIFVEDDAAVEVKLAAIDRNSPPRPERLQEKGMDFHPSCKRNTSQLFGTDEDTVSKCSRPMKTARATRRK